MKPVGGELLVWACQRANGDRRGLGSNGFGVLSLGGGVTGKKTGCGRRTVNKEDLVAEEQKMAGRERGTC